MKVRHWKGGSYEIVTVATSSEDFTQKFVIYESKATHQVWAREWENFWGQVEVDGKMVPRFEEINEVQD